MKEEHFIHEIHTIAFDVIDVKVFPAKKGVTGAYYITTESFRM